MRADESGAQNAGQPAGGSKIDAAAPFLLSLSPSSSGSYTQPPHLSFHHRASHSDPWFFDSPPGMNEPNTSGGAAMGCRATRLVLTRQSNPRRPCYYGSGIVLRLSPELNPATLLCVVLPGR
jgi:hypothetical protein